MAEIDIETNVDDLDHSGFVVKKHHMDPEFLDPNIAKGIMKVVLADFKKRSISWKYNTRVRQHCVSDNMVLRH